MKNKEPRSNPRFSYGLRSLFIVARKNNKVVRMEDYKSEKIELNIGILIFHLKYLLKEY